MNRTPITLLDQIQRIVKLRSLRAVRKEVELLTVSVQRRSVKPGHEIDVLLDSSKTTISTSFLLAELKQIAASRTLPRAQYYLQRLIKALTEIKTGKLNDLNLRRWKEYDDLLTDSLWMIEKRDRSGEHTAGYWGNFIPQIPNQLLRRFTKQGDWVLDPFLGSGTTLIECKRLGRNGVGIELQPSVATTTGARIEKELNPFGIQTHVLVGDSAKIGMKQQLNRLSIPSVQFAMLHPPYWDIIKFSNHPHDLSNAGSLKNFLYIFGDVVQNVRTVLEEDRYMAIVISDKYSGGEWVPLGFYTMQEALKHGFKLKSIIVKNFETTKAKRSQEELWRYRALVGGWYVFKHEYIFLMQKTM